MRLKFWLVSSFGESHRASSSLPSFIVRTGQSSRAVPLRELRSLAAPSRTPTLRVISGLASRRGARAHLAQFSPRCGVPCESWRSTASPIFFTSFGFRPPLGGLTLSSRPAPWGLAVRQRGAVLGVKDLFVSRAFFWQPSGHPALPVALAVYNPSAVSHPPP